MNKYLIAGILVGIAVYYYTKENENNTILPTGNDSNDFTDQTIKIPQVSGVNLFTVHKVV